MNQNGSRHLHAIYKGIHYQGTEHALSIYSMDAALVSVGTPTALPTPFQDPDLTQGLHFNLHNNIWSTNYPLWFPYLDEDANMAFRFTIAVK